MPPEVEQQTLHSYILAKSGCIASICAEGGLGFSRDYPSPPELEIHPHAYEGCPEEQRRAALSASGVGCGAVELEFFRSLLEGGEVKFPQDPTYNINAASELCAYGAERATPLGAALLGALQPQCSAFYIVCDKELGGVTPNFDVEQTLRQLVSRGATEVYQAWSDFYGGACFPDEAVSARERAETQGGMRFVKTTRPWKSDVCSDECVTYALPNVAAFGPAAEKLLRKCGWKLAGDALVDLAAPAAAPAALPAPTPAAAPAPAAPAAAHTPIPAAGPAAAAPPAASSSLPGRLQPTPEEAISIMLPMKWEHIKPTRSLLAELLENGHIRNVVPMVDEILDGVKGRAAILAYTHDLQLETGEKDGNLYYELNKDLRRRGTTKRAASKERWGTVVHYLLKALSQLPTFTGTTWRGMPDKEQVIKNYKLGRPVQWGAFSSTSTSFEKAREFCAKGVILKIAVTSGNQLGPISFFPAEGEVLLPPTSRFVVSSEPYNKDGVTCLDMVQQAGNPFLS